MGSSRRVIATALLTATAMVLILGAQPTYAEEGSTFPGKFTFSGEVLGVFTEVSPVENAPNPDNMIEEIEDFERDGDLRLKFEYKDVESGLKFRVQPWIQVRNAGFSSGDSDFDRHVVIGRYLASWHDILPSTTLSAHRSVVAWGPGFLSSPSNPFPIPSSTDNPLTEQAGLDFWHVSTAPFDSVNAIFYHNFGLGADDDSDIDPFQEAWSLNLTYMDFSYSAGLAISHKEDDGMIAGLYGQWTASESSVVWADLAFRERGRAYYPVSDPTSLVGGTFVNDPVYAPEVLLGASYTTEDDTSFYLEYLYNGAGYSNHELDLGRDIQRSSADIIGRVPALGIGTLQTSALTVLDYRARHIVGMTASRSLGPVDLQVQNAVTPQDWSGRLYGSATYSFDRYKISLSAFQNYGGEAAAFRQDIDHQASLAFLARF